MQITPLKVNVSGPKALIIRKVITLTDDRVRNDSTFGLLQLKTKLVVTKRDVKEEILKVLRRRPLSLSDLSKGMGISQNELDRYIEPLTREGKIYTRIFGKSVYYEIGENQGK